MLIPRMDFFKNVLEQNPIFLKGALDGLMGMREHFLYPNESNLGLNLLQGTTNEVRIPNGIQALWSIHNHPVPGKLVPSFPDINSASSIGERLAEIVSPSTRNMRDYDIRSLYAPNGFDWFVDNNRVGELLSFLRRGEDPSSYFGNRISTEVIPMQEHPLLGNWLQTLKELGL